MKICSLWDVCIYKGLKEDGGRCYKCNYNRTIKNDR